MDMFAFIFTIFFSLAGPVKLIRSFAGAMADADAAFQRAVAIRAFLVACAVVAFLALAGGALVAKYKISVDALRISGGLVLVLSALRSIFPRPQALPASTAGRTPLQVAISPIVNPLILSPAAVAAILIIMMLAPEHPGMGRAVIVALTIILVLDLIVMYFNASLSRVTWLILVLQLLGAVLTFMQICLGVDTILMGLQHLGAFPHAT